MDRGRGSDPDRPANPEEGPRRVGDVREEREGTGTEGRTEGDEHLGDRDAGRDAGAAADAQAGWNVPSRVLPAIGSRDLPEPVPFKKLVGASVIILATALGSGEFII